MHVFALSIGIALLASAFRASAHYLWIERQDDGRARLYFGEYQDNEREKSGGRLDEIRDPRAWFLDRHARRRCSLSSSGDRAAEARATRVRVLSGDRAKPG